MKGCETVIFSSLVFLFVFLPIALSIYYLVPRKGKNFILLLLSLVFYAWGEPIYVFLMLFSILIDYVNGLLVEHFSNEPKKAKLVVLSSIIVNLAILMFFKYTDFFLTTSNYLFGTEFAMLELSLPIGISFYTFQTMSYTIDIFRKDAKAQRNIIDFGAYVAMFPQLVAGPIVRYQTVADQLNHRIETEERFATGIRRFVIGMGKKVLLANNIGMLWSRILETDLANISVLTAWLGLIAFGFQIYFDFSGYSDMAIGLAKLFGFDFLENFNYPYISRSITEFWRRWHISLGTWFKDYVYIPLGGNQKGKWRTYRNIFIVWFLTGFWHGASWNFILWGLYFGCLLMLEKAFLLKWLQKSPAFISHLYTIILLIIGWGLFAFEDFNFLRAYFRIMFGLTEAPFYNQNTRFYLMTNGILFVCLTIGSTPFLKKIYEKIATTKLNPALDFIIIPLLCLAVLIASTAYLVDSSYNPFLYFRF